MTKKNQMDNYQKKALEIYNSHYMSLFDSESDKGQECLVSILAQKASLITINEILKLNKYVDYFEKVKQVIVKL